MRNRYVIDEVVSEAEWRALIARADFSHMTQTWAFGEAKRATKWRPRRLAIQHGGETVAVCQVLDRKVAGLPVLARINLGPMMLAGHADESMDVLHAIRSRWRYLRRGLLLIAPALSYSDEGVRALKAMGFRLRSQFRWASSRLDLRRSEAELRQSLAATWRNRLKNAERHGLRFIAGSSPADAEWMVEKHIENAREKGFTGPSAALLRGLYRAAPADFMVFRAAHEEQPVAAMAAYRFGEAAHYYVGWFGAEGRRQNAGNFLFWNAALRLKQLGCTQFDLGGHNSNSGFGAFKLGMRGAGYELLGEFVTL